MTQVNSIVSVIVPTRNSAKTLDACLQSIRLQVYMPIELIVIDNQSSDLTPDIARRHAEIVDSFGPERSAQRNHGARLAHGDYLLFVDSDMTLSRDVVGDCVRAALSSGAPGVIIPETSVGEGFWAQARALERSCYVGDDTIEAARFFPRAEFEKSGGFNENLVAMEDWDLSKRIAGGRRLPRTSSDIQHDEGRLRLASALAKKRYYGAATRVYWRTHGRPALGQINLVFRPAFLRNWKRLLQHPLLTAGFLSLKSLETAAATLGAIEASARKAMHEVGPSAH